MEKDSTMVEYFFEVELRPIIDQAFIAFTFNKVKPVSFRISQMNDEVIRVEIDGASDRDLIEFGIIAGKLMALHTIRRSGGDWQKLLHEHVKEWSKRKP